MFLICNFETKIGGCVMTNFNIDTSYFSNMAKSISEVAKNIMPPKINYSFLTEETKKLSTIADKLKHPKIEVDVPHEYAKEMKGQPGFVKYK